MTITLHSWRVAYRVQPDGVRLSVHRPEPNSTTKTYGIGHGDKFASLEEARVYCLARGYIRIS